MLTEDIYVFGMDLKINNESIPTWHLMMSFTIHMQCVHTVQYELSI